MPSRHTPTPVVLLSLLLLLPGHLAAQDEALRGKHLNLGKNALAIQGYDPVAYLTEHKAVEGEKTITYAYRGAVYRFASKKNLERFKASPDAYEPAYGGWCAYAMGNTGEKVEVDPETFKVIDGKVYLFYNFYFNNTLKSWNKREGELKSKADNNWKKLYR